jgi:hypothetical protein
MVKKTTKKIELLLLSVTGGYYPPYQAVLDRAAKYADYFEAKNKAEDQCLAMVLKGLGGRDIIAKPDDVLAILRGIGDPVDVVWKVSFDADNNEAAVRFDLVEDDGRHFTALVSPWKLADIEYKHIDAVDAGGNIEGDVEQDNG